MHKENEPTPAQNNVEADNKNNKTLNENEKINDGPKEQGILGNELAQENAKLKEQILRIAADLENLRKRSAKEIEESGKFAITKFARELIEVLENLYRAESSINTEQLESNAVLKNIFSGVELTKKSLVDTFERHGIKRIEPLGEQFNPDLHQAITHIPSNTHKDGEIIQVIQAGYVINGRILRPSLVAVAKSE